MTRDTKIQKRKDQKYLTSGYLISYRMVHSKGSIYVYKEDHPDAT